MSSTFVGVSTAPPKGMRDVVSRPACRQCGSDRAPQRGRCSDCGAFIDASAVGKARRREKLSAALAFDWFDWVGELLGIALIACIAADLLPAWAIIFALVLIARPFIGVALRVAARAFDAQ
jgi:hypothetical protein